MHKSPLSELIDQLAANSCAHYIVENWRHGTLRLVTPDGHVFVHGQGDPMATWIIRRMDTLHLPCQEIHLGVGYATEEWDTPDLPTLLQALVQNQIINSQTMPSQRKPSLFSRNRKHVLKRQSLIDQWPDITDTQRMQDRARTFLTDYQRVKNHNVSV